MQDFSATLNGLPGIELAHPHGERAFIARQGAQLLSWQTADGRERFYLSALTRGMKGGDPENVIAPAIRGGIPISFPQFSGRGPLPKHGFVRGMPWQKSGEQTERARFFCRDAAHTQAIWPQAFEAESEIILAPGQLTVTLAITNRDNRRWTFTAALHSYLRVDDVRNMRLTGLHGVRFEDATDHCIVKVQQEQALRIEGELDRVYLAPPPELLLEEDGVRPLRIAQQGFTETVVWNPGPVNARALADFPDDDWLHMVCVEAACASTPVTLEPDQRWEGKQVFSV